MKRDIALVFGVILGAIHISVLGILVFIGLALCFKAEHELAATRQSRIEVEEAQARWIASKSRANDIRR